MSARTDFIAGLRACADWLESNPQVEHPRDQRMLLCLMDNPTVEAFASEHNLKVTYDTEGNAAADVAFGPVVYHAFGYADFDGHCEAWDERKARQWAARKGLKITDAPGPAGLTEDELKATVDGTYRCVCGHWDNVHGPFCFAESCRCGSFEHRSVR